MGGCCGLPQACSAGLQFSVVIDSIMQASVIIAFKELVVALPLEDIVVRDEAVPSDWTHLQKIGALVKGDRISKVALEVGRMIDTTTKNAFLPCRSLFDLFARLMERFMGDGLFACSPGGIMISEFPEVRVSTKALLQILGVFVQTIEVASVLAHIGLAQLSHEGFAVHDHMLRHEVSEAMTLLSDTILDLEAALGSDGVKAAAPIADWFYDPEVIQT